MFDSSKYLFILCNQGAGGHRLGRIISCIDNVLWYSDTKNGDNPWDTFFIDSVAGKNISPNHYDRIIGKETVPLLGERIERWWNKEDLDNFYNDIWSKEILKFQPLLATKYIHWVIHDVPQHILSRFPNAKVIALVDNDIDAVVDRFLKTSAKFPCYYHHKKLKPNYLNNYAKSVDALEEIKKNATDRDLWIFKNYLTSADYDSDYQTYLHKKIKEENDLRSNFEDHRYLKITWQDFDINEIIDFLQAKDINPNYKILLQQ